MAGVVSALTRRRPPPLEFSSSSRRGARGAADANDTFLMVDFTGIRRNVLTGPHAGRRPRQRTCRGASPTCHPAVLRLVKMTIDAHASQQNGSRDAAGAGRQRQRAGRAAPRRWPRRFNMGAPPSRPSRPPSRAWDHRSAATSRFTCLSLPDHAEHSHIFADC